MIRLLVVSALVVLTEVARAEELPTVPVGLDAYRQWDKWPQQRIGVRAYMRSTYDRRGGNEGADASHFLYQQADDFNVTLDVEGPGVLYFARYNHWHGSPWHYVVDGTDHIVRETQHRRPEQAGAELDVRAGRRVPQAAGVDVVGHEGRGPVVGADRVREVVPDGVLAHALRDGVLHLPPVRAGHPAVAADQGVGRRRRRRTRTCWS